MKLRRIIAIGLVVLGGILIFFATETVEGVALIALGLIIELIGVHLERKAEG